jgi:tetratricopeptide (TPR) repeat protein
LPLTLKNAGSYLNADSVSGRSFRDYEIELLMTAKPELKSPASDRDVPLQTFEISLNYLDRRGVPQARSLLRLLSCYASPTPIPRSLLQAERMRALLVPDKDANPRYELEQGLQELKHLSLIEFEQDGIVVHPVVADSCRAHLHADDDSLAVATLVRHMAVELMADALGELGLEGPLDIEKRPDQWPVLVRYGPHLHALFGTVADRLDNAHVRDLLKAATSMAQLSYKYGSIAEAKHLAQAALDRIGRLPDNQVDSLATRHYLAWFLVALHRPEAAEELFRNVLDNRERILGPSHPDTLWTRHELAWVKASRGHWAEAEAAYREVLEERCRALSDDDPCRFDDAPRARLDHS